jgi:hypothetical protein
MNHGMPPPRRRRKAAVLAAEIALAAEANSLSIDGIEVVQVVQDMDHSVTLIAGKRTIVRVYLSRPAGAAVNVRGEISVRRTPNGAAQNVPSLDTARVRSSQNGNLQAKREDLALSLNFRLPDALTTAGRIFIRVASLTNATTGAGIDCTNCDTQSIEVKFKEAPPLRVRLLKIRYRTPAKPSGFVPTARDATLFKSWVNRAYPVSNVIFSDTTVESDIKPPFDDDTSNLVNAQLSAIRNLDIDGGTDQRTHYYGMVSDGGLDEQFMRGSANEIPTSADPTAVASGPTGSSGYAWDTDGSYGDWYGGHELAHTFGRRHPGFCNGNSGDDDNFPFEHGQLSNGDGALVGVDVGDTALGVPMKALPGHRWHDVMTYCARQWMSSYTYEGIRRRLAKEDALGPSPAAEAPADMSLAAASELEVNMASGNFINVVATINLTRRTGKILYVNPVSRALTPALAPGSDVEIRVLSADDQTLDTFRIPVKLNTCAESSKDQIGIIDAIIPSHPDARQLQLLIGGQLIDTFRAAAATPAVSNLRREETSESAMSFAWDAPAEAESTNVRYNIQSSTDDGNTWTTLAVGLTSPELSIDRSQYPPGSHVTVRVIATDGFTSTVTSSETFAVDAE